MLYKYITVMMMCAGTATYAHKQDAGSTCAERRVASGGAAAKTTIATIEENDYDVKHLKFNLALTNTSTNVSGDVTTTAQVTATTMPVYAFELDAAITIDSFKLNGVLMPVTSAGAVRKVTLSSALSQNTVFTAQVFYHGAATAGNGQFFSAGLHPVTANGFKLMYSISDDLFADDWWPCKQSLQDKIDSVDMWVTVDDTLKVGSNGLLKNTVALTGNKVRYEWKTKHPIEYYLISVAIAPYNEYSYYMHYTDGSNDSMLIQNYVYNTPGHFTPTAKAALDSTGLIVDHFSNIFGRYAFDDEKYGHSMSPLGGGMEHQTMTTMGTGAYTDVTLIAHELGHQWWGNNVSFASWRDVWLSEGITSYCEQLFVEKFRGAAAQKAYRTMVMNQAKAGTGSVYVDDTTQVWRIFDGTLTYKKGASVTHMLRYLAPQDSLFFKGMRTYRQQFYNGTATTKDLKLAMESVYGTSLDTFFNQWIYGEGYPSYNAKWAQQGNTLVIQLKQTTTKASSVPCFHMPIEIKLITNNGDKIIKLYNNANTQTFVTTCTDEVSNIQIDPDDHILNAGGLVQKDNAVLKVAGITLNEFTVQPNPASDNWLVKGIPAGALCILTDMAGKVLWQQTAEGDIVVPAKDLAPGSYTLSVSKKGSRPVSARLIKY
ncbi:MAG: M1 family aminopeptidase [Flavipsychrobacter sp.]